jgi:hypothetical protein
MQIERLSSLGVTCKPPGAPLAEAMHDKSTLFSYGNRSSEMMRFPAEFDARFPMYTASSTFPRHNDGGPSSVRYLIEPELFRLPRTRPMPIFRSSMFYSSATISAQQIIPSNKIEREDPALSVGLLKPDERGSGNSCNEADPLIQTGRSDPTDVTGPRVFALANDSLL